VRFTALMRGDVLRLDGFKVATDRSKASLLSGTLTVATVEAPSISNDGSSYVVIYREQAPSDNAADNPLPLPPVLRIDSDAAGNPILTPWQPPRPSQPRTP
jgi:hypothetical protein